MQDMVSHIPFLDLRLVNLLLIGRASITIKATLNGCKMFWDNAKKTLKFNNIK